MMRCGTRALGQRGEKPPPSLRRPRDPRALLSPSGTRSPSPARLSRAPGSPPPSPGTHPAPPVAQRTGRRRRPHRRGCSALLVLLHPSLRGSGARSELPDPVGPALPIPGSAPVPAPPPSLSALTHRAAASLGVGGGTRSRCPMGTAMRISRTSRARAPRCPQTEPGPRRGAALPRPSPAPPDGAAPAPPRPRAAPRPPRRRSPVGCGEQRAAVEGRRRGVLRQAVRSQKPPGRLPGWGFVLAQG